MTTTDTEEEVFDMGNGEIQIKVGYFGPDKPDDADPDKVLNLSYADDMNVEDLVEAFSIICEFLGFVKDGVAEKFAECDFCETAEEYAARYMGKLER